VQHSERRERDEERRVAEANKRLSAANSAIGTTRTFFFGLLSVAAYIGVVVAGTTDEQLLRDSPVNLPIINVDVPRQGFYLFVPWLFVVLHLNLLIHLGLTSSKLKTFLIEIGSLSARRARQLSNDVANFPLAQWLVGHNDRMLHLALSFIVVILLVLAPPYLLLWMQLRFLSFQSEFVTGWQAAAVIVDVGMIFALLVWFLVHIQPARRRKGGWELTAQKVAPILSVAWNALVVPLLLAPLALAAYSAHHLSSRLSDLLVANQDLESVCKNIAQIPFDWEWEESVRTWFCAQYVLDLHEAFLTRNKLPAEAVNALRSDDEDARNKALDQALGLPLLGRSFRGAEVFDAVLPKADLREAQLQEADLSEAQLQGANLRWAQLQGADLSKAQLQGANLESAELQGADLELAKLQGADLESANLQHAALFGAQLQAADLSKAQLQGANLRWAQLQGAELSAAQLQGADLLRAQLQGANLGGAQLQGANLELANLQDARLYFAQLQSASLRGAQLQGAKLTQLFLPIDLEWADLTDADLGFADLSGIKNLDTAELAGADYVFADGLDGTILDINQPPPYIAVAP
jgi:uncharacterized protein YjbI with pentapeptide repeats